MGQGVLSFDSNVRALMSGLLVGDIVYLNGTSGDDNSSGLDWTHAVKSFSTAQTRCTAHNHDYILAAGVRAATAPMVWATPRLHVMGVGFSDNLSHYRGCQCTITYAGTLQTLAASNGARGMEIAGINFICGTATTSQIMMDDLGSAGVYIHDCTFENTGESATPPIHLDIETADWTIRKCVFLNVEKAIDSAARINILDNYFQSVGTSALGVNLSNTAADQSIIAGNMFAFTGGTTDKGIVLAANVISCIVDNNQFMGSISDPITPTTAGNVITRNFLNTFIAGANTYFFKGVVT